MCSGYACRFRSAGWRREVVRSKRRFQALPQTAHYRTTCTRPVARGACGGVIFLLASHQLGLHASQSLALSYYSFAQVQASASGLSEQIGKKSQSGQK